MKKINFLLLLFSLLLLLSACVRTEKAKSTVAPPAMPPELELHSPQKENEPAPPIPKGFVRLDHFAPEIACEVRYYSDYNFVGEPIDGYKAPVILLTKEAATALKAANESLNEQGLGIKVYDGYRPQQAVDHFVRWSQTDDTKMKADFYPDLEKESLIPNGFIAAKSGHSRGSTADVTLIDLQTGNEMDMGGTFDFFGEKSHTQYTKITKTQYHNRQLLQSVMTQNGFKGISTEWWHFTLQNEPYPDTYFDFPVQQYK